MATERQELVIGLQAVDMNLTRGIRQAETMARAFDRMRSMARDITGMLTGAALGTGGVGLLAKQVALVNSEIQSATVSLAGLYSTLGDNSWQRSMGAARSMVRGLQDDAAKGAGELKDYLLTYQLVMSSAGNVLGTQGGRDFTRRAIAAGSVVNPVTGVATVGIDVQQALRGGVSQQKTPIISAILESSGMLGDRFNQLTTEDRIKALDAALQKYETASVEVGKTFSAQAETFVDKIKGLTRAATGPVFDTWTVALASVNDWLEQIIPKVEQVALAFGGRPGPVLAGGGVAALSGMGGLGTLTALGYTSRALGDPLAARWNAQFDVVAGRELFDAAADIPASPRARATRKAAKQALKTGALGVGAAGATGALGLGAAGAGLSGAAMGMFVFATALSTLVAAIPPVTVVTTALVAAYRYSAEAATTLNSAFENVAANALAAYDRLSLVGEGLWTLVKPLAVLVGEKMIDTLAGSLNLLAGTIGAVTYAVQGAMYAVQALQARFANPNAPHGEMADRARGAYNDWKRRTGVVAAAAMAGGVFGPGILATQYQDPLAFANARALNAADQVAMNSPEGRWAIWRMQTAEGRLSQEFWDPKTLVRTRFAGDGDIDVRDRTTEVNIGKVEVTVRGEVNEDPRRIAVAFGQVLEDTFAHARQAKRRQGLR